jgi:DNA-binding response OmpR family regulator
VTAGPRVLVVEDSEELRRFPLMVLQRAGIEVEAVADGEEALARAGAAAPDVVVSDRNLPGIAGLETCRRVRELCGARTLLLSGTPRTDDAAAAADAYLEKPVPPADLVARVAAGADAYLTKPFSPTALVTRVRGMIARPV